YAPGYKDKLQDPLRDRFARSAQFFIDQKARIVRGRLPAPSGSSLRLLDAGCGQGSAFAAFGEGVKVFGSDVSVPMLTEAVARGPVVAQEPYDLPFADSTFDGVYAFCIYHHIPDEDHVRHLSELRRVVAPGGEVMVFEH